MISHVGGNLQCIHSADFVRASPSLDGEGLWLKYGLLLDLGSLGVLVIRCSVPIPGDRFPFCKPPLLLLPCCFFPKEKNPSTMSIPDSPLLKELLLLSSDLSASASSKCSNCSSKGDPTTSIVGTSLIVLSMVVGESDPVLLKLFLFLAGVKGDSVKKKQGSISNTRITQFRAICKIDFRQQIYKWYILLWSVILTVDCVIDFL